MIRPCLHVLASAAVLTLLNAAKPVCIDDPAYLTYASEFRAHPLDPYRFEFGTPITRSANLLLVPPVLPYWLALGMSLFGDQIVLLKLWLFPFAWIFAGSASSLLGRFAPDTRTPMVWMIVLAPSVLPTLNLMLDVPALALGLAAVALAIRSLERNSIGTMIASGLLAGLAIQTKYNAAVASAAIAVWCVSHRRWGALAVAAVSAAVVAVGWEWFVSVRSGESHFLVQFGQRKDKAGLRFIHLTLPLLSHFAGLVPAVAWLALRAGGAGGRVLVASALLVPAGMILLALFPSQEPLVANSNGKPLLTLSNLVYGSWALFTLVAALLVERKLFLSGDLESRFLLVWFALEIGGAFALSPFPASRRVIGPAFVFSLMVARQAHLCGLDSRILRRVAAAGACHAGILYTISLLDAEAARAAANEAVRRTRSQPAPVWHFTWEGASHYLDRAGLLPLQVNRNPPRVGDYLVMLDASELNDSVKGGSWISLELLDVIEAGDGFPLQTTPGFSSGATPLEHHRGPRVRLFIHRITAIKP
jgi:hypothetical protein